MGFVVLHHARLERKQGEIAAHADILSRMRLGAALADDDIPGNHRFIAEFLDAEPF